MHFHDAEKAIARSVATSDYVLIAIDQPTIVPNLTGMRPVERVAGSIVNRLKGGVQPAYRQRDDMFGPSAPIWRFLNTVNARQNVTAARSALIGCFMIEVFPALALPTMAPEIWRRQKAARYNPANKKFVLDDWKMVTQAVSKYAMRFGLAPFADRASRLHEMPDPKKADQDKLDSIICVLIGWAFRKEPSSHSIVIGDEANGFMVAPASPLVRSILTASAAKKERAGRLGWGLGCRIRNDSKPIVR
jgi:predicted RNase H-like nuclease